MPGFRSAALFLTILCAMNVSVILRERVKPFYE